MEPWPGERARHGGADEVPVPGRSGHLWLCGKHYIGPDPDGALERVGAGVAVCLCERHELEDRYPAYVRWLDSNRGGRSRWYPIHDLHAPATDEALTIIAELDTLLGSGRSVLMHCGAGIGRAGTMAAALLIHLGADAGTARGIVASSRPMAGPEAGAQSDLLDRLSLADRDGG